LPTPDDLANYDLGIGTAAGVGGAAYWLRSHLMVSFLKNSPVFDVLYALIVVIGALTMMHSHKTVRKIGGEEMSIPPQTLHRMWLGFFLTVIGAALVLIHAFLRI
jgi:hypothetical protein